jgi:uncharacterized protein YPO0396
MSRKISLTRLHAINWYGYNDTIEIDGNLLLAGVTGSGKSILMDLIQLVLVGSDKALFNRSATGTTSERTLRGYCLLDTKREENGVAQYAREKGAITYIALEFTWPKQEGEQRRQTWGFRIEFRNASETHGRVTPFFCEGTLAKSDFLDALRCPLEFADFKRAIEARDGHTYETQQQYLREMSEHLNFNRGVLDSLLPTAMSFTNLKSFDEFCRRFILPGDHLNIADVVGSYKNFLAYERDLRELQDQLDRLIRIRDFHRRYEESVRDSIIARYLSADLESEHAAQRCIEVQSQLERLKQEQAGEQRRIEELDGFLQNGRSEREQLQTFIVQSPQGQAYTVFKDQNKKLVHEIEQLRSIGTTLDEALRARVRNAEAWLRETASAPLPQAISILPAENAVKRLASCEINQTDGCLRQLQDAVEQVKIEISRVVRPSRDKLDETRRELGRLNEEITALQAGHLPFPTAVLNAINAGLPSFGHQPAAQPLCKLVEVVDERWRPAIEVAFTRKFAVVVDEEHYENALKIYHAVKTDSPLESLVNPVRAVQRARPVKAGSLAEKLQTSHPVAQAIISQLFGDLMCVESREQLSAHEQAILPDGFMARGSFIERRRHYDNLPFVGKRGLEQQLAVKRARQNELQALERQLRPSIDAADHLLQSSRERFPEHASLAMDLVRAQELPKKEAELQENITQLQRIDRSSFDEKEKQIQEIDAKIAEWSRERDSLLQSQRRGQIDAMERSLGFLAQKRGDAAEQFQRVKNEADVSPWIARLQSWKAETLARLPALDAAAREFDREHHRNDKEAAEHWGNLVRERDLLIVAYPKFQDLSAHEKSNSAYEKLLARIDASDIPGYREKAEIERKRWENLFRTQILSKLHSALQDVTRVIQLLNSYLKAPIGNDRYEISKRVNPEFKQYHTLLELNSLNQEDGLFFASVEGETRAALEHFLQTIVGQPDSIESARLLDYRHYYDYDLLVSDANNAEARPVSVDKQSGKFSGGENQSPYFIAILASYLRAYKRHERRWRDPSLALVPIDEAFSKLSGERIADCINALKALELQGVFSMSSGNIPYAFELCDQLIVVSKHEERNGRKTRIRNVPVSMRRDSPEARELIQIHA